MRINRKKIEPIYQVGDLLLKIRQDDYWFDHVIILNTEYSLDEYVYELFTSEGNVERRTVEWVQLNYRKEDDFATKDNPKVDTQPV
jgi:hypothetical protein